MNCKRKLLLALVFLSASILLLNGQTPNHFNMPVIVPSSPELLGLGKYGDVPVSTYTGTPDISIPIYTVKIGKLSLPITLSYHASGIGVSQESSWVGLGWNLIAGGSISYIDVGGYDNPGQGVTWAELEPLFNYLGGYGVTHEDGYVDWGCMSSTATQTVKSSNIYALLNGVLDRDVYSANFLGYSFKFVKSPKNNSSYVFLGQQNKCTITSQVNASNNTIFNITGEDGTVYQFEQTERHNSHNVGWFLTKIVSVDGNDISLRYKSANVSNLGVLTERVTVTKAFDNLGGDNYYPERDMNGIEIYSQYYLDEIETKNELIKFESDASRTDMNGALVLNRVIVKDKFNQSDKLVYRFKYGYFIGSTVGGNSLYDDGTQGTLPSEVFSNRLRLDSLKIGSNSLKNYYYFDYYNNIPLPKKTSYAVDYWGNYNGQENGNSFSIGCGHTIIPNIFALKIATQDWYSSEILYSLTHNGANRGASEYYITAGMLKSIQYPTKGKTVFEYEAHDFRNARYLSAEDINAVTNNFSTIPDVVLFRDNVFSEYDYIGGGVRIKNITNFDENNNIILQKRYSYINDNGESSGRLLIPLSFLNQRDFTVGSGDDNTGSYNLRYYSSWILNGNSYVSLSPYSNGNNVGYDKVTVESYDSIGNTGKNIFYYSNNPGIIYANKPYFMGFPNGLLMKNVMLTNMGDTVLVENNIYSFLDGIETSDLIGAYAEDNYSGPTDFCIGSISYNPMALEIGLNRFNIYSYPITNYYNVLTTKETTDYLSGGKVNKTSTFTYNPSNFCVSSINESTSINSINKYKEIKYPVDYSGNSIMSSMVNKNQINIPIEQSEYENTDDRFTVTTNYSLQNNLFYAPSSVSSSKYGYGTEERLIYDKYDNYGNVTEAHQPDNIKESYIYGYNQSFPVVKGSNIDEATLNARIQQSLPAGFSTLDALLINSGAFPGSSWATFNSNLRNNCPYCLITTYTYDPVYGITSSTDANNVTTYYEYDELGRLKLLRDSDGRILKTYEYHYK